MLATQLGPISSKLAECNEMLFLDVFLVHDPQKSPAYEQERRQKGPLQARSGKDRSRKKRGEGERKEGVRGFAGPLMVEVQGETGLM